jgi:hypothetical protein
VVNVGRGAAGDPAGDAAGGAAGDGAGSASARVRPVRPGGGQAGFALLMTIFVVFLLGMALALIGLSLTLRMRLAQQEARAVTLTALSDAALAEALAGLAADAATSRVGEHAFGSGTIGSQVERVTPTRYRVTAFARFAGRSRTVLADVLRDIQGTRVVHWQRLAG